MQDRTTYAAEFTACLHAILSGGRKMNGETLVPFSQDMPIGSVARWDDRYAVRRSGDITWEFIALA